LKQRDAFAARHDGVMDAQRTLLYFERALTPNPSPRGRGELLDGALQLGGRVAAGGRLIDRLEIDPLVFGRFEGGIVGKELKFGFGVHALIVEHVFCLVNSQSLASLHDQGGQPDSVRGGYE
ncbi:MAG TPA: hypothetical protein VFF59_02635, partial [Anaerolineae bacterium]|nr:hypothetical protein [Anaerolineae bacterium]